MRKIHEAPAQATVHFGLAFHSVKQFANQFAQQGVHHHFEKALKGLRLYPDPLTLCKTVDC